MLRLILKSAYLSGLLCCLSSCDDGQSKSLSIADPSPEKPVDKDRSDLQPSKEVQPAAEITVVRLENLYSLMQGGDALLVDCRQALFHHLGSIDGSVNLPVKKFDSAFAELRPRLDQAIEARQVIVLYCQNKKCPYAYQVGKRLASKGYPVTLYEGGWEEWKESGL